MEFKKLFLRTYSEEVNHAGSKAVDDCEIIMRRLGYKEIYCPFGDPHKKLYKKLLILVNLLTIPFNSILVVEHPIYTNKNYLKIIKIIKTLKNIHTVFIIHDLECIRKYLPDSEKYAQRDFEMFSIASVIICHNNEMKQFLIQKGVDESRIIPLEIFDFINNSEIKKPNFDKSIIIAGNLDLSKSSYLDKLLKIERRYHINLFGPNFQDKDMYTDYTYYGSFSPDDLPDHLRGAFGLVWDGDSLDGCSGPTGNYLKYNNPHKVSLYISCGIPVIIWKEAALADYIREKNLGLAIDSLQDIEKISITSEEYSQMINSVRNESEKLRNGAYLNSALEKMEKLIA